MNKVEKIQWTNEKRKLGELVPWTRNPRLIMVDEAERLSNSYKEFDQVETIAIGPNDEVYNGHQRLNVWIDDYGPDFEIDVRVANRELTEREREKLTIFLHRGTTGEWDLDALANEFEVKDLLDWGFKIYELGLEGGDIDVDAEWLGMPEYGDLTDGYNTYRTIFVHFDNQQDVDEFVKLMDQKITEKTKYIWFPWKKRRDLASMEYQSES